VFLKNPKGRYTFGGEEPTPPPPITLLRETDMGKSPPQ